MKKLILIILSFMLLVGCGKYNDQEIRDEEKSNVVNSIENNSESLKISPSSPETGRISAEEGSPLRLCGCELSVIVLAAGIGLEPSDRTLGPSLRWPSHAAVHIL